MGTLTEQVNSMFSADEKRILAEAGGLFDALRDGGADKEIVDRMQGTLEFRLAKGQADYGALDLDTDKRDFDAEAGDEACDAIVYRIASMLQHPERANTLYGAAMMEAVAWAGGSNGRSTRDV